MGTFEVALSRHESATITVEADDAAAAKAEALAQASDLWESDTSDTQVDNVAEVVAHG